jgi:general secretion pathway protein D
MGDRKTESVSKIPLLGDLPLLGALFRSKKTEVDKTNLLLVLTPHIVRSDEDFTRIFERKLDERQAYARFMGERASKFSPTMNWQRKVGPFGRLDRDLGLHMQRLENGGGGDGEETVVGMDVTPSVQEAADAVSGDLKKEAKQAEQASGEQEGEPAKPSKPAADSPKVKPDKAAGVKEQ